MKNRYLFIMMMVAAIAVAVGCNKNEPVEAPVTSRQFLNKSTPGLYSGAKSLYVFTQTGHQLYVNKSTNTYRIVSQDGSSYVQVVLDGPVSKIGTKYRVNVSSVGLGDSVKNYNDLEMEILNRDSEYCWLWSDKEGLGILLYYIL